MKLNMTKIAAAMILLGSVGAHAAVDPASVKSATADLEFKAPTDVVTLNIAPVTNLTASLHADGFKVADVAVTPTTATDTVALRWTPGNGVIADNEWDVTVPGENADNKLTIRIADEAKVDADSGYWVSKTPGPVTATILVSGDQTIAADKYKISMDAGIWTA